jgi:uncharacterized protein
MDSIELKIHKGKGAFVIEEEGERLAEMIFHMEGNNLVAEHTEVLSAKLAGQGAGRKLLAEMVRYARENKFQVIPYCPFVHAQFRRRKEEYADIWKGD